MSLNAFESWKILLDDYSLLSVVEASKTDTVVVLGSSTRYLTEGEEGTLTCAVTGANLVDRITWKKIDGSMPTDVEEHNIPGQLHFNNFKVTVLTVSELS